ncbi:MAG TPA: NAD-dependent epimerase/dehydratase family protein [Stellaceae bacterium]|nr:NAD-dependent epimerase/dehydratase family protein [Stellaceae bacterium]
MRRVCLVGAGYIAQTHADVLASLPDVQINAIVDPNLDRATGLARRVGSAAAFASVEAALGADAIDCAHVLVPPNLHLAAALPLISAGKPVLLEKPLAVSAGECERLITAAAGTTLGVNQNFVFHPAFAQLRALVQSSAMGPLRSLQCLYNMPLRQLTARQFGHWMFDAPENLLLEQAVHPLSQIVALGGDVEDLSVLAGSSMEPAPGVTLFAEVTAALRMRDISAVLQFAVGQSFPCWRLTAICDDGTIVADMLANSVATTGRSRWLDAADQFLWGNRTALQQLRATWRNARDYGLSTLRLVGRRDAFFQSMKASIAAFHRALDEGRAPESDGRFGARLVRLCEEIRDRLPHPSAPAQGSTGQSGSAERGAKPDVAVIGGTGFIGTHLTRRLTESGLRVSVMARNLRNLPSVFHSDPVTLHRGDIGNPEDVAAAIAGAEVVVNLAHGGASGSREAIRKAMVDGAACVARACLAQGVRRLVHVGSTASLYLGPQSAGITGMTPADPRPESRADYARAKILCDRMLQEMAAHERLPLVILRPAVVVGDGGTPFHSALGLFNNEQHCIGWNAGRNPLPFVTVADVADAIALAVKAKGIDTRCYNLAGDVRLSARDYIEELGSALCRPLRFHPKSPTSLWLVELLKWCIKRATGRPAPMPTRRDFLSRGMKAQLDCADAKRDLGWRPIADRATFVRDAIEVHAPRSRRAPG